VLTPQALRISTVGDAAVEAPAILQGQILLQPVSALKPYAGNARKHTKSQIAKLATAIEEFGFVAPILVDAAGGILAGHARLEAAKRLKMPQVPTLRVEHLSDAQKRAYIIADNRLAELAQWDQKLLVKEIEVLIDLDFPVEVTGFSTPEIDGLLRVIDEDEAVEELDPSIAVVSRLGDLWQLGSHRLYCGDSTLAASYATVLGEHRARVVFTDPPYNVPIVGHVSGSGKHGEFAMASGEMSAEQFTAFLTTIVEHLAAFSLDGSLHFVCMDWRHMSELLAAGEAHYAELKNLCIWNKDNGGMGSLYRSKHELIFLFKNGKGAHVNNIELGRHGRNRTNVWSYPGATSMSKRRSKDLEMHPTVKPIAMVADALLDCSNRDDIVLDPFGGSGSTLMAAQATGRRAALIELDPKYVDVTVRRFLDRTGQQPVHARTGLTFDEIAAQRQGGHDEQA